MTQICPGLGKAPVPGWVSMIFSPDAVVMTGWALVGAEAAMTPGRVAMTASAMKALARKTARISASSLRSMARDEGDCLARLSPQCKAVTAVKSHAVDIDRPIRIGTKNGYKRKYLYDVEIPRPWRVSQASAP